MRGPHQPIRRAPACRRDIPGEPPPGEDLLESSPGAGTVTGLLKGGVELLTGNTHGLLVVLVDVVAGLLVDLGFLFFQLGDNLLTGTHIGGGREGDTRHLGEALMQNGQLLIFAAEVVPPLRHAVGFVDGKQG